MPSYARSSCKPLDCSGGQRRSKLQARSAPFAAAAAAAPEVAESWAPRGSGRARRRCAACADCPGGRASRAAAVAVAAAPVDVPCRNQRARPSSPPPPRSHGTSHPDDAAVPPVLLFGADIDSDRADDSERDDEENGDPPRRPRGRPREPPRGGASPRDGAAEPAPADEDRERQQARRLLDEFRHRCELNWKRKTLADSAPVSCEGRPAVVQRDFPVRRREAPQADAGANASAAAGSPSWETAANRSRAPHRPPPPRPVCTSNPRNCPVHRSMSFDRRLPSARGARAPRSLLSQLLQGGRRRSTPTAIRPYSLTPFGNSQQQQPSVGQAPA